MTVLHLGVVDVPHGDSKDGLTTGDLAEILERKYHVMEVFAELHGEEIANALAESAIGALENATMGAPVGADPFAEGASSIDTMFRKYLDTGEIEGLGIPGVPTQAAKSGVSHRKKNPNGDHEARRSFIDTGIYEASMRSWVDGQQYLYSSMFDHYAAGFSGLDY